MSQGDARDECVDRVQEPPSVGVDPGALALATAAAGVTFVTGNGDWSPAAVLVGISLGLVVIAFHRPVGASPTPRHALLRLAFGAVIGLTVAIGFAWPLQELVFSHLYSTMRDELGNSDAGGATTSALYFIWAALAVAALEPPLSRLLDRPRRSHPRSPDSA